MNLFERLQTRFYRWRYRRHWRKLARDRRGVAAVEFALVLVVAVPAAIACGTILAPPIDAYATHLTASITAGQALLATLEAH